MLNAPSRMVAVANLLAWSLTNSQAADINSGLQQTFEADHGWKFGADLYGWLPQIQMKTVAGDEMELPLSKILQNLNFTVMAGVSAQNGKWSAFSDFIYMNLQGTQNATATIIGRPAQTGVGIKLQALINTSAIGYSFIQNETSYIRAFVGGRYLWLKPDLSFNIGAAGGNVVDEGQVFDAIVGLRGRSKFADNYFVTYYADVGTGQSDMTWQALAGVGYQFKKFDAVLGYRYLDWDFSDTANMSDLTVHGPFAGIKVRF